MVNRTLLEQVKQNREDSDFLVELEINPLEDHNPGINHVIYFSILSVKGLSHIKYQLKYAGRTDDYIENPDHAKGGGTQYKQKRKVNQYE